MTGTARRRGPSELELELAFQLRVAGIDTARREYLFAEGRKFRFDFAWPDRLLAVEVDGGTYSGGRHVRGDGFHRDCEKSCLASVLGWRVMHLDREMVKDGSGLALIQKALEWRP